MLLRVWALVMGVHEFPDPIAATLSRLPAFVDLR